MKTIILKDSELEMVISYAGLGGAKISVDKFGNRKIDGNFTSASGAKFKNLEIERGYCGWIFSGTQTKNSQVGIK